MQDNTNTVSRRTVASGLAWSVPAVAAVSAAPAFANSPGTPLPCPDATATTEAIKYPGNSSGYDLKQAYGFGTKVTNTVSEPVGLAVGSVTVTFEKKQVQADLLIYDADPCQGGQLISDGDPRLELGPGESVDLWLIANNTGNSANEAGCIDATLKVVLLDPETDVVLCETVKVEQVCFTATPPTATC